MSIKQVLQSFYFIVASDLVVAWRNRSDWLNPLVFFVIIITLFPLALGNDLQQLAKIAPAVIWVAALLAMLLAIDNLFRHDYYDGILEQMLLSPQPLALLVFAKIFAHWCVTGLPFVIIAPVCALMLNVNPHALPTLIFTLLLGTPVLSIIGAIQSALTISLQQRGVLLALLILPLAIPVLIFASNSFQLAANGQDVAGQIAILAALLSLALCLGPWTVVQALRVGVA